MRGAGGNIFVMIFVAILLIGLLTVALRGFGGKESITDEDLLIEASNAARYGAELASAVDFVLKSGASENDLRFAPPSGGPAEYGAITTTPTAQIFSRSGGNAEYRRAPSRIMAGGSNIWEFYGTTAIPEVGSDRPELIAVLPDVTQKFCEKVNQSLGLTGQPDDSITGTNPDCLYGGATYRFGNSAQFSSAANVLDSSSYSKRPMTQGCVTCSGVYHYYYVLMSR
jgi:hypothetical protein